MRTFAIIISVLSVSCVFADITEFAKESVGFLKDFTATDGLADKLLSVEKPIDALKEFATSDVGKKISKTLTSSEETLIILTKIASSDLAKEWGSKLGKSFITIAGYSKKFSKYAGPAGDIINFALDVTTEQHDETVEYLKNITEKLEKIDAKLDSISDQIKFLDAQIIQSTKKITLELKLLPFIKLLRELTLFQEDYETIIEAYASNSTALLTQLDKHVDRFQHKKSDSEIVTILDSGDGVTESIVDELISLRRIASSGSSTMKSIYDIYIIAFMKILKSNIIQESVVNLKTAITGNSYELDRRLNIINKNKMFKKFFASFEKAFKKLNINDIDGSIDLTSENGDIKPVRMINVLQYFWENEDKLSIIDTCSDDCEHFQDRKYSGGGCYGSVKKCKFAVSVHYTGRYLRQNPQVDRIYLGYYSNGKWSGQGNYDEGNPNMESKKSYPRGFYNCHVCKCICDQYSHSNSVRRIYTGKISAPDGYVVTGIRFIEKDKTIYPQIEVGKLLPLATVDQNSVTWLNPPDDRSYFDFGYDRRQILFGDPSVMRFTDAVVTGVRFESIFDGPSWSIYGRDLVNFNTGLLGDEKHIQTPDNVRSINFENLVPGLNRNSKNFKHQYNSIVKFEVSDEDNDAGQSFVPYFDGNDISFKVKSPLSGISLMHYTNDDEYAGYIRPVIKSLDYRKFFSTSYRFDEFIPANFTGEEF